MKKDYSKQIYLYLKSQNINNSRKGYIYLVAAVESCLNHMQNLYYIMKIYEEVANRYGTTGASISKAIGDVTKHTGLTAKEFIAAAVYNIIYLDLWGGSDREDLKMVNEICWKHG